MTYQRPGETRHTVVLSPSDLEKLDALRDRSGRSHAIRRSIRLHYALRGLTNGSKLQITHPDGTVERVLMLP